jgi:uncharacterized Zn-finger protein
MRAVVERRGGISDVALESLAIPASHLIQSDKNSSLFGREKNTAILYETGGIYSTTEDVEYNLAKVDNGFMCKVCEKVFGKKSSAVRHINTVHYLERRFYCPLCKTGFKHKTHLKRHLLLSCKMKK